MGRWMICLLVLGLANLLTASELGLDNIPQSEIKEIEAEIEKGNVPPDYTPSDKAKRGVAKLTNADTPTFNHLSTSSSTGASTVKTATAQTSQTPYRYVYNNQYYQTSPYISYIQSPQAAQIASQYPFQASPLAHYLHTPTQIQYVSTPTIAAARYQTVNSKVAGASTATAGTGAVASQYQVTPTQQFYISPQSLYQAQTSGASTHSASSNTQYQTPQLYYPQQPIVMLLVQPQPNSALLYPLQHQQQQQASYVLGQHPFLYNNHRFALPYTANNQVTYLVPMAVQTTSAQAVKTAATDKSTSGIQTATSGVSYGVRTTKA